MPAKLERCVKKVIKKGNTESESFAYCKAALKGKNKKKKKSK